VSSGQPSHLAFKYLLAVNQTSSLLSNSDTLILVLVGHGYNELFVVGNKGDHFQPTKNLLESVAQKGTFFLSQLLASLGAGKVSTGHYWLLPKKMKLHR
jgi:hypothetical protein